MSVTKQKLHIDAIARRQFVSLLKTVKSTKELLGQNNSVESVLLSCFMIALRKYYKWGIKLSQEKDTELRQRLLVRKLSEEWANLLPVVTGMQVLKGNDEITTAVHSVVNCAWGMLQTDFTQDKEIAILPHYGRQFELVSYKYAPDIVVLGIPTTSLYSPWDWTMIWHEIAGIYVRSEAAQKVIAEIDEELKRTEWWQSLLKSDLYREQTDNLPHDEENEDIPGEEVRYGWLAELIEDAFGIFCLGKPMADSLNDILTRYYNMQSAPTDSAPEPEGQELPGPLAEFAEGLSPEQQETFIEIMRDSDPGQSGGNDLRHPPIPLRIAIAQLIADGLEILDGELSDTLESALAQLILSKRNAIIREGSTSNDNGKPDIANLISDLLSKLNNNQDITELIPVEGNGDSPIVATLFEGFEDRVIKTGDKEDEEREIGLRGWLINQLSQRFKPFQSTRNACTEENVLTDLDMSSWEKFYGYELSHIDMGQASFSSERYSSWWGKWIVTYSFSGVYCPNHSISMSGYATTSHR